MRPLTWIICLLIASTSLCAQEGFLILKRKNRNLISYFKGSHITLQLNNQQWIEGRVVRLSADSMVLDQEVLRFNGGPIADTLRFYGTPIGLNDIYALPTTRELVNHYPGGGINVIPGHEKFLWIRNGFIFRVIGAGYAGLNIGNHIIDKDPPFAQNNLVPLVTAAGVFVFGLVLQQLYHPHYRLGKKYHFQFVPVTNELPPSIQKKEY